MNTPPEALSPGCLRADRADVAVLDVRDEAEFRAGHLKGSGNVPEAELAERRSELPPRDTPVLVVSAGRESARRAAQRLGSLGYARVQWLDGTLADIQSGLTDRGPAARLWRPSPFLETVLPLLPDPRLQKRRVLDLAAGAGRESVFLALQGYEVEAWDHDKDVLARARAMAERHGVSIATKAQDLEIRHPPLPVGDRDVVVVFRFLHRPLFPRIAGAVAPGGAVVYETYLSGQERFGKPKHPRFLLVAGELPRHFPGFDVERYEEHTPSGGPFLARLLARRRG